MPAQVRLSCRRCRQKKLKCDKETPCGRCEAAGTECSVAERKLRAANLTSKGSASSLGARVDFLEQAIQRALHETTISPGQGTATPDVAVSTSTQISAEVFSKGQTEQTSLCLTTHSKPEQVWVTGFKEVRKAMNETMRTSHQTGYFSPNAVLSNAITALDGTIADLHGFTEPPESDGTDVLSNDEAREAVQVALKLFAGEFFTCFVDHELMISLASVIDSPQIQIEISTRVIYYCLLFQGYTLCQYKSPTATRRLYLQCLQVVPPWQAVATGTILDLAAASLLSLTCVLSSDEQIAWGFHCRACEYVKNLGIDRLDAISATGSRSLKTEKDIQYIEGQRIGYWQLVLADAMYRLCDSKPALISVDATIENVSLPNPLDLSRRQPSPVVTIRLILWTRITFIVKDFLQYRDMAVTEAIRMNDPLHFHYEVESYVKQIETLLVDWNVLTLMRANSNDPAQSWYYADIAIGAYTCICSMERFRANVGSVVPSNHSLRASRIVLDIIAECHQISIGTRFHAFYMQSIAFYPFQAFFVLYYHILGPTDTDNFKEDIERLEKLATIMVEASQTRFEYIFIAKAIVSLNLIVKYVHQARASSEEEQLWTSTPEYQKMMQSLETGNFEQQDPTQQAFGQYNGDFLAEGLTDFLPTFEGNKLTTVEQFRNTINLDVFEPLSYMQEVEHQFNGGHNNHHWI